MRADNNILNLTDIEIGLLYKVVRGQRKIFQSINKAFDIDDMEIIYILDKIENKLERA